MSSESQPGVSLSHQAEGNCGKFFSARRWGMQIDKTFGCSSDPWRHTYLLFNLVRPSKLLIFLLFRMAVLRELAGAPGGCAPGPCANDPNLQGLSQQIYPVVRRVCASDLWVPDKISKKKKRIRQVGLWPVTLKYIIWARKFSKLFVIGTSEAGPLAIPLNTTIFTYVWLYYHCLYIVRLGFKLSYVMFRTHL